jgi:hypothetical protein
MLSYWCLLIPVDKGRQQTFERAHQPAFSATDVYSGTRRTASHGIDNRLVGDKPATLDFSTANSYRPWVGVVRP